MELLKRLFQKLGKQVQEKDQKHKSFVLQTNISVNDLENKKKKAIEFMKKHSTVKFYMKVNVYDQDNIAKGKLMLTNLAEDLKEYSKVEVHPSKATEQKTKRVE
jgi:translation initiation factor IF-3